MGTFSAGKREQYLNQMTEQEWDVLVIGGGITGAGIALDAQTRGLRTALVEMQDFAGGTSSRSTKLVHGGLRYLKQLEIGVVAEVGKERAIVYENGPHVTTPEWMLLPIYEGGTFGKISTSFGLRVYDYLAGVKKGERRRMLSAGETLSKEPLLKQQGLKGGGYYVEYRTDDARLTIEVLKEAVRHGALAVNYAKVEQFIYENKHLTGVEVTDQFSGRSYELRAKHIINAAGPWVDTLREKDHSKEGKMLHLSKGVHLVFDQGRFPLKQAIYFDTPDRRMMFAIPRDNKTYVGTTDTNYKGDLVNPLVTEADRVYILQAANEMFPGMKLTDDDVESSWAGLRPLIHQEGKSPSEISRKDEIFVSASGLISMAGGKLTGYRKMAETVVDLVARQRSAAGLNAVSGCQTVHMPISGGDVGGSIQYKKFVQERIPDGTKLGLSPLEAEQLVRRYGSNIDAVYALMEKHALEAESAGMPVSLLAALLYSIEEEMSLKPVDFFIRRTGALFFNIAWVESWKDAVTTYMGKYFGWTIELTVQYSEELKDRLAEAIQAKDA
ncbi:glycerol-3-phosphate dehydrogenase/oxidase [Paenibacillus sp. NPDC057934]|uniref:glycerol-3-phosphate dehydrogenase/oxidase n=1 Tax=Paenibacillus sp. NPDC057934 TaxID=3346282 RepID=UPI0036DCE871